MKLKEITFVLENCDLITIDGKYIGNFVVEDIRTSIQRIACNSIDKMDVAHTLAIEIHKDADKTHYAFGFGTEDYYKESVFDRIISYDDITSIQFELVDEYVEGNQEPTVEHYNYFVDWTGESNQENNAQKSYISKVGNLYVVIADGKNIEDFFVKEDIDDNEYMDFVFSMCGIGDKYSANE